MDASAYLQKQGWRGEGHSLDHTDRGIKKPLLVSKKVDVLGVGLNKHAAVSDQWWLRAFDQGLKDFGTGKSSLLSNVQKIGVNRGGLYGRFTKGEGVPGTFGQSSLDSTPVGSITPVEPRKEPAASLTTGAAPNVKLETDMDDMVHPSRRGAVTNGLQDQQHAPAGANAPSKKRKRAEQSGDARKRQKSKQSARARAKQGEANALASGDGSLDQSHRKREKYEREKLKRELKRAAEASMNGENLTLPPPKQQKKAKKEKKRLTREEKEAQRIAKAEARTAKIAARAERKIEIRARRAAKLAKAQEAKVAQRIAQAAKAQGDGFEINADEVKLDMGTPKRPKRIPGVGVVDRYPTKAEKKAKAMAAKRGISIPEAQVELGVERERKKLEEQEKVVQYRAMKQGMTVPEYRAALANGKLQVPAVKKKELDSVKHASYAKRAAEKGMSVEAYIARREEKYAAKQGEKLGSSDKQESQAAPDLEINTQATSIGGLAFVVDTTGEKPMSIDDPAFATQVNAAIANRKPFAVADAAGKEILRWEPDMPVPQDPRFWTGIVPKELPKLVRAARREWMATRRREKKFRKGQGSKENIQKKSKGARKVEAQEGLVRQILAKSRKAAIRGGADGGMAEANGVKDDVPVIAVASNEGIFQKSEVELARRTARRFIRNNRRAEKAEKKKGLKKRGR